MLPFKQCQDAVKNNDPPIEVNQRWIAYVDGEVYRCLRILALHPDLNKNGDRMWIFCDERAEMKREYFGPYNIGVCPEFNLRFVFELET